MTLRLKTGKVKNPRALCCADDILELEYEGGHSNGTTTLHFDVIVRETLNGKFTANIRLSDDCEAESIEKALERLASWCQRAADGIKEHKFSKAIPT